MKVTELRINNWVQFKHTETPVRVILGDFVMAREYKDERLDDYEPIPLTEEWLVKFGFEKHGDWYCKPNYFEDLNVSLVHRKTTHGSADEITVKHPEHIHSLQNLYFALTGEELKQKEMNRLKEGKVISNTKPSPKRPKPKIAQSGTNLPKQRRC